MATHLLQLCTVASHVLNLYLIAQVNVFLDRRTDRKALTPGSYESGSHTSPRSRDSHTCGVISLVWEDDRAQWGWDRRPGRPWPEPLPPQHETKGGARAGRGRTADRITLLPRGPAVR